MGTTSVKLHLHSVVFVQCGRLKPSQLSVPVEKRYPDTDNLHNLSVITLQLSPNNGYAQQNVSGRRVDGPNSVQVDFLEQFAAIPAEEERCPENEKSFIRDGHY